MTSASDPNDFGLFFLERLSQMRTWIRDGTTELARQQMKEELVILNGMIKCLHDLKKFREDDHGAAGSEIARFATAFNHSNAEAGRPADAGYTGPYTAPVLHAVPSSRADYGDDGNGAA